MVLEINIAVCFAATSSQNNQAGLVGQTPSGFSRSIEN